MISRSGLFDAGYYTRHNPDVSLAQLPPLAHYVVWGGKEGRNPHPLFDSFFYRERYPDVAQSGVNPLAHYICHGQQEGRIEIPLVLPDAAEALAPALTRAVQFIEGCGRRAVRLDLSEDRPDHHRIADDLGFRHRWTFIQMVNWLSKPVRIPIRVGALQVLPHERHEATGNRQP